MGENHTILEQVQFMFGNRRLNKSSLCYPRTCTNFKNKPWIHPQKFVSFVLFVLFVLFVWFVVHITRLLDEGADKAHSVTMFAVELRGCFPAGRTRLSMNGSHSAAGFNQISPPPPTK
ncbi:MAG: hypothetical protein LBB47_04200 [Spirochaetaceae bacterium]|nr:hypothetical protein [Spirochaetaceae bacterium]